ncbi:MAG TPA: hypothetical protein VNZ49_08990 [Bacteroidia bacterium]|jgi:hypothetical protein|nr:hypothetical protein [Bacteroidia bacterium]
MKLGIALCVGITLLIIILKYTRKKRKPVEYINKLSFVASRIYGMANKNLEQLEGKVQDSEETQDYYVGMLRRQAMIANDLSLILVDRPSQNLTTPYILLRTLMDDFLHVMHLDQSPSKDEDIIRINAKSYRDNFMSVHNLTKSEIQEYSGETLGYLNPEALEELKNIIRAKPKINKYLEDSETLKFKKFIPLTQLAEKFDSPNKHYNFARDRTYHFWKSYSSFVHFSIWCYEYELREDILNLNAIEECFQYVFNTVHFCASHFKETKGTQVFIDPYLVKEMRFALLKKM